VTTANAGSYIERFGDGGGDCDVIPESLLEETRHDEERRLVVLHQQDSQLFR
jgi:hypothetical protein